jgi:hypothetical protein
MRRKSPSKVKKEQLAAYYNSLESLPEPVLKNVETTSQHHQQHHQNKRADRRILEKIAKLISLVQELRTDLPNVHNRDDSEAEVMKQATDLQAVLEVLEIGSFSKPPNHLPNKPLEDQPHD